MSGRNAWISDIDRTENATARALEAKRQAVELRLALRGAERRGGCFAPDNVALALDAMPVIERAIEEYCELLRTKRGALREQGRGNVRHDG